MNYAVMETMFGDYWVGRTKLEPNGVGIFATWDEAVGKAKDLNDSLDNLRDLEDALEAEAEVVEANMEKWIVGE